MSASDATIERPEAQAAEPALARPPRYRVIMLNDDFTPMAFVVALLVVVFRHSKDEAERLMWKVHTEGRAVVGVYPREIAESKVAQVHAASRAEGHPLRCILEREAGE